MGRKTTRVNNRFDSSKKENTTSIVLEKGCVVSYRAIKAVLAGALHDMNTVEVIPSGLEVLIKNKKKVVITIQEI